jgi:tRNA nucleotidyltransferase/poly(A) polymerase
MHQVKEIPVAVTGDENLVRRLLGRELSIARRFFTITVPDNSQETATQANSAG